MSCVVCVCVCACVRVRVVVSASSSRTRGAVGRSGITICVHVRSQNKRNSTCVETVPNPILSSPLCCPRVRGHKAKSCVTAQRMPPHDLTRAHSEADTTRHKTSHQRNPSSVLVLHAHHTRPESPRIVPPPTPLAPPRLFTHPPPHIALCPISRTSVTVALGGA